VTLHSGSVAHISPRERAGAWSLGLVLLLCAVLLIVQLVRGSPWDTRITSLLPESAQSALLEQAESQLTAAVEDRLTILVGGDNPQNPAALLINLLREHQVIAAKTTQGPPPPAAGLSDQRYHLLSEKLRGAGADAWAERAINRLYTPGLKNALRDDPFGLLDSWISQQLGPVQIDGEFPVLSHEGERWLVISGDLTGSPYDMSLQKRLADSLRAFHTAYPDTPALRAGLVFHAAAGAAQAKQEISSIGLGSLLGVLALLWLVFRDARTLLSLLIPLACGLLFALPLSWLIFGTLNLLTLAFGASLIGVAIDYALHLQCVRHLDTARPLRQLWPALRIGLLSSLAAYMVQVATPMPGLRQMATFALLGLLGAWLTVRFWLPLLPVHPHPATDRLATRLDRLQLPAGARWPWLILLICALLSTWWIATGLKGSNDLRELNTSPPELIDEQRRVQSLAGGPGGSRYLMVTAADPTALLARLESLDKKLAKLSASGQLDYYRHIAQAVPAAATQEQNLGEIKQRYNAALPLFISRAGLPQSLAAELTASIDQAQPLTIDQWLNSPLGQRDRALWIASVDGTGPAAIIPLGEMTPQALGEIEKLAQHDDVLFQDTVGRLSTQFSQLRDTIALWLLAAVIGLALLFAWRYRAATWRVLLPPVGAVIATVAVSSAMGTGLTLFHLLGLLLVLGIGLDAGIFSVEHAASRAAWLAVTLSCASSLLAFGLLALSRTPALAHVGSTCLIGLTCTWLLVPFARAGWPTGHRPLLDRT
jgi:predicted exporter